MAWSLEIHHLDVNQGDSTLIVARDPNQVQDQNQVRSCLIDGGLGQEANGIHNYITQVLGNNGTLDVMVATHFDADHFGGLRQLLGTNRDAYRYTSIYDQGQQGQWRVISQRRGGGREHVMVGGNGADNGYLNYTHNIQNIGSRTRVTETVYPLVNGIENVATAEKPDWMVGQEILWGPLVLPGNAPTITGIAANQYVAQAGGGNVEHPRGQGSADTLKNAKSLAFLVEFNNFRYYIGGDIETTQEDGSNNDGIMHYLNQTDDDAGRVHAMKCSHHGSQHSSSQNFIIRLRPKAAFMSCGIGNNYGGNTGLVKGFTITTIKQFTLYSLEVTFTTDNKLTVSIVSPNPVNGLGSGIGLRRADNQILGGITQCNGATIQVPNLNDKFSFYFQFGGAITLPDGSKFGLNDLANNSVISLEAGAAVDFSGTTITIAASKGSKVGGDDINDGKSITIPNPGAANIKFTKEYGLLETLDTNDQLIVGAVTLVGVLNSVNGGHSLLVNGHPNQRVLQDLETQGSVTQYYMTNDRHTNQRTKRLNVNIGVGNYPQAYTAKAAVSGSGENTNNNKGHVKIMVSDAQSNQAPANTQFTVQYRHATNDAWISTNH
ncbi:MAG: MBL fold metallo-hydrolase [Pseudomonadales bacterium]